MGMVSSLLGSLDESWPPLCVMHALIFRSMEVLVARVALMYNHSNSPHLLPHTMEPKQLRYLNTIVFS